jgi:hypothetical protein
VTYKVTITKTGETTPFWTKSVPTRADADRVAHKNQRLIDREGWKHTIGIEEVP